MPTEYPDFLAQLKARIVAARSRAALAVNSELIKLYWEVGHDILERERREGWGAKVMGVDPAWARGSSGGRALHDRRYDADGYAAL
jgi:hypothetical protein